MPDWMRIRLHAMLIAFNLCFAYAVVLMIVVCLFQYKTTIDGQAFVLRVGSGLIMASAVCFFFAIVFPALVLDEKKGALTAWTFPVIFGAFHFVLNALFVESHFGILKFCRECFEIDRFLWWWYAPFYLIAVLLGKKLTGRFDDSSNKKRQVE